MSPTVDGKVVVTIDGKTPASIDGVAFASTPAQVTGLTVVNTTPQLKADWSDLSDETSYELFYSTSASLDATTYDGSTAYPGTPDATAGHITGIAAGTLTYTLNGMLTESTTYYVKIAGWNDAGLGTLSSAASAAAVRDYFGTTSEGFSAGLGWDIAAGKLVSTVAAYYDEGAETVLPGFSQSAKTVSLHAGDIITLDLVIYDAVGSFCFSISGDGTNTATSITTTVGTFSKSLTLNGTITTLIVALQTGGQDGDTVSASIDNVKVNGVYL
jgi:hypothetical protein